MFYSGFDLKVNMNPCNIVVLRGLTYNNDFSNFIFVGMPYLATYIFLLSNDPELATDIDPDMVMTPFGSRFEPTTL